ncbi:MAG: hypothetical protein AABX32_03085 [Nanoarchaeota archaeon]
MTLQNRLNGKVAIVHPIEQLSLTLSDMVQSFGPETKILLVTGQSTPQDVAAFVADYNPNLLLLAENYSAGYPKKGEGIPSLTEIKKTNPSLPVLMVSGGPEHQGRALEAGANGYLPQVVTRVALEPVLRQYL